MVKIGPRPQLRAAGTNPAELSVLDPLLSLSFFDISFDSQMEAIYRRCQVTIHAHTYCSNSGARV